MPSIGTIDSLKISVLLEDYAGYETSFLAQHGISLLLEARAEGCEKRILLDVGQSGLPILHNMRLLGISPASIDAVVLSHCHYDHTEGLVEILQAIGKDLPVIAHPDIFRDNYIFQPFIRNIGITGKNGPEAVKAAGGQLFLTAESFEIMPGVLCTGEVPRKVDFEKPGIGTFNLANNQITGDRIMDDISLAVNVRGKGLVIVVGCSHAGIVNIVNHIRETTGIDRIEGIIGGLHLIEAGAERIRKTAEALKEINPGWVAAGHCTGFRACVELAAALGDRFQQLHAGKIVEVG